MGAVPLTEATFESTIAEHDMVFREGVLVLSQPGALPAPVLDDLIAQVRALDTDVVHAELAESRSAQ
jgi:hypothetical protein